ncbi:MAG: cysteine desulfurase family protein [Deferribacterota bacterium]|nr:cysteine desulfurase family protein [Deferribacterota bacterium]
MIFLDNIATTKPDERVVKKMLEYLTKNYGNPSAHFYQLGRDAFEAVVCAREKVAELINCLPDNIIFTSCGTESNNLAIKGTIYNMKSKGKNHIIVSELEHYSVLNSALKLTGEEDLELTKLKVDEHGFVDVDRLARAIKDSTALVAIHHANPEIGTIQNIEDIGRICKEKNVLFFVDAVASCGHIPVDVEGFNCDLLSIAAQNFYGPKGAGALYVRDDISLRPLLDGGFQERGLRAGTENVPAIVGMGEAASIAKNEMPMYTERMKRLGSKLIDGIRENVNFVHFTGSLTRRLPGHVSLWVEYIEGESILLWLSLKDICATSGSACSSNIMGDDERSLKASHVLSAIGVPDDICAGSVTFSMSKYTDEKEIDYLLKVFPEIVERLCKMSPFYNK